MIIRNGKEAIGEIAPTLGKRRLPHMLDSLPTIEAEVKYEIGEGAVFPSLEGPAFDRDGNFYVCFTRPNDTYVKKIAPDGVVSDFFHATDGMPVGLAFHKDGRLFATDMMKGTLRIISPEGQLIDQHELLGTDGKPIRCDVPLFDPNGNLLITDLRGTTHHPSGGIFRYTEEDGFVQPELYYGNMASPNGIGFSSDGKVLWIAESDQNNLSWAQVDEDYRIIEKQFSPIEAFKNPGKPNTDTFKIDALGNIYLGIMFGGRLVVLDREGMPLLNVVVPGFAEGKLGNTPNLALHPERNEGYLVASDRERAVILSFPTFAPSQKLFSHA